MRHPTEDNKPDATHVRVAVISSNVLFPGPSDHRINSAPFGRRGPDFVPTRDAWQARLWTPDQRKPKRTQPNRGG